MPGSDKAYISLSGVSLSFGGIPAVAEASLDVAQGTICGLAGSDGAGKSTLLRAIAGMLKPDAGAISIGGQDAATQRAGVKRLLGYMPQRFGLYQDLTVEENMVFFMDIFGIKGAERKRRLEKYLGFSNLLPYLKRPAGQLSGGMKQKLGLACVLVHEPRALILDEPTNGVDPVARGEFWDILAGMRSQGMTILVATAYLDEGEKCDTLAFMHQARILEVGAPAAIRGDFPDLEEALIQRIQRFDEESSHERVPA